MDLQTETQAALVAPREVRRINWDSISPDNELGIKIAKVNSLPEAIGEIWQMCPQVVIFDSDGTLRDQILQLKKLHLGGYDPKAIDFVTNLRDNNTDVFIVSNQPKKGHQVAHILSRVQGNYPYFPEVWKEELGEDHVFAGSSTFFSQRYKSTQGAIDDISREISPETKTLVVVGDRGTDMEFAAKLQEKLGEKVSVYGLKLPEPIYDKGIMKPTIGALVV